MHRVDVDMMLSEIGSRQYLEWKAFYALDPWGDQRADVRTAIVAAVMANAWRGKDEGPIGLETFMLFPEDGVAVEQRGDQKSLMARIRSTAKRIQKVITG
jgi:hypothetical protein